MKIVSTIIPTLIIASVFQSALASNSRSVRRRKLPKSGKSKSTQVESTQVEEMTMVASNNAGTGTVAGTRTRATISDNCEKGTISNWKCCTNEDCSPGYCCTVNTAATMTVSNGVCLSESDIESSGKFCIA